jgi:hypothetical protein
MSFTSQDFIDPNNIINYSGLAGMKIYQTDIQSSTFDGYFKVSYNSDKTNVISSISSNKTNYKATNIYFYSLIHNNILGVTDDSSNPKDANGNKTINGELIIENTLEGGDSSKLYLCFLLQKVSSNPTNHATNGLLSTFYNNIIINSNNAVCYKGDDTCKSTATINIANNDSIPIQNKGCISYYDSNTNSTVIVFLNPITYNRITNNIGNGISKNNDFDITFLKNLKNSTDLFNKYPLNDTDKHLSGINNNSGSSSSTTASTTIDDDKIYIDCNPTGESEEKIKTYNLPIHSDLMGDIQNSSISKLLNNFVMFGILLLVSYIGIPKLYNYAVCDKLSDEEQYYARAFIVFYFIVIISSLFIDGSMNGNMTELFMGFFFIFLAIITYVLVLDVGTSSDFNFNIGTFVTFVVKVIFYIFKPTNFAIVSIFEAILIVCYFFMKDKDGNRIIPTNIVIWIGLLMIPSIVGLITWISI